MKALVDTGSPATIVGLKFALKVLATQRRPGQSPQEWTDYVQSRMQQLTVTLQSYGGGTLNILRQMTVQMSKGSRHYPVMAYIQDGAPVDLLLGTDVLPFLGFQLQEPAAGSPHLDLLSGRAAEEEQDLKGGETEDPVSPQVGTGQTNSDNTNDRSLTGTPNQGATQALQAS